MAGLFRLDTPEADAENPRNFIEPLDGCHTLGWGPVRRGGLRAHQDRSKLMSMNKGCAIIWRKTSGFSNLRKGA